MVRTFSLPKLAIPSMIWLTIAASLSSVLTLQGCGRKGDPLPQARRSPAACGAAWSELRTLEIQLPRQDIQGNTLLGLEAVRIYYLPLDAGRPTPQEMLDKGEVILERRRPDLPAPGEVLKLDFSKVDRASGWLLAVAVRVGNVIGAPGPLLPWLDPRLSLPRPSAAPTTPPPPTRVAPSARAPGSAPQP